jgi:hypothetical protein
VTDDISELRALERLAMDVRSYAGSEQTRLTIELLRAIEASYVSDLCNCGGGELVQLQTSIRQCVALRKLLSGDTSTMGRL